MSRAQQVTAAAHYLDDLVPDNWRWPELVEFAGELLDRTDAAAAPPPAGAEQDFARPTGDSAAAGEVPDPVEELRAQLEHSRDVQRLILAEHRRAVAEWGGQLRTVCARCRHMDGPRMLWPCPTRQLITGEAAPQPQATESVDR